MKRRPTRKGQKARSRKSPSSTREGRRGLSPESSRQRPPHWARMTPAQKRARTQSFSLLRFRREGMSWRDAEKYSGVSVRTAQRYLPKAFFRDSGERTQAATYDPYVERLQLPTVQPGQLRVVHARGSRQRSLSGQWLNALKAAGGGDFGPIDAFPKQSFIDGFHLVTEHEEVQRILEAQAESDSPLEELYALTGAA